MPITSRTAVVTAIVDGTTGETTGYSATVADLTVGEQISNALMSPFGVMAEETAYVSKGQAALGSISTGLLAAVGAEAWGHKRAAAGNEALIPAFR